MRTNKFAKECASCRTLVEAGAGTLVGPHGGWKTYCSKCEPKPPARGDHPGWHDALMASLDFETTGVDPKSDRVVSYALLGGDGSELCGLINPGIPIPSGAAAVHGISDEQVANAPLPQDGIRSIVEWINNVIDSGTPLVVFNACYDLTMLRAEADRWGVEQPDWDRLLVIDSYVIDWGIERGRLGPSKLTDVCAFYGIEIGNAHDATCDARAAREAAQEMSRRNLAIGRLTLVELMQSQRDWYAVRAEEWNNYARKSNRSLDDPHGWPLAR